MSTTLHKNIAIGKVPPTPTSAEVADKITEHIKEILIREGMSYGFPVGYAQEQNGSLIQNIFPVKHLADQQISASSKVTLALHTETAFHPYKPDYLLLLCLRGDPAAATTYANLSDILLHLTKECVEILKQKWFLTGVDISFRTNNEPDIEIPISILSQDNSLTSFIYDETVIKPINAEAAYALSVLKKVIPFALKEVVLESGDLLVIDNHQTIHGRKPFKPKYDGTDRWLQRLLVRKVLPPSNFIRNGCIIDVPLHEMKSL